MRLSFSSLKQSAAVGNVAAAGGAALASSGSGAGASNASNGGGGGLRNRAMICIAVCGLSILGYKMFWPESEPLKAKGQFAPKPAMTAPKSGTRTSSGANAPRAGAAAANGAANSAVRTKARPPQSAEETDVPTAAEIGRTNSGKPMPATRPTPSPMGDSLLGPTFVDENNGFSVRFPAGWTIRTFNGEPWVLDCGNGRVGLMSIGFSPFPADFTADNIPPEWVARRIKKRDDTTLHSQGYALIAGKKSLWSKSTGPLPMTNASPKMTRVNYIVPLNDGRVLELRIAATPDIFEQLMPTLRASVESFKLLPRPAAVK